LDSSTFSNLNLLPFLKSISDSRGASEYSLINFPFLPFTIINEASCVFKLFFVRNFIAISLSDDVSIV
jgi:hypothetical protein